ncbi:MAG TPA: AAA family ATPase, partial [bacterium]|nr:AAA family ATPase [bacterium]
MIFEDLLIRGFGNLSNVKFEFGQGLNVFVAPNEAGKSTLAECLFRCLYGFPPLRSDEERAAYKRFQPLNGDRYSAKLRIATDEQTHYELDRDFAARTLRIRNAVTGEDVTGQFPVEKKGQDVLLAQNLLGISRDTFRTIAFLAQGLVDRLENGQELSDEIRKIADSGEFQTGYKKALEKLKKASDTIGKGERASSKPLWEAQERVNTLQREREEICAKRKERITALERIEILKHQLAEADRACLELEVRGLALQQARVRATIGQLETLGREIDQARAIAQQLDGYRNVPCHRRDELFVNADRLKGVQQRLAQYQSQLASLDAELSAINDRLSETEHLAKLSEKDIEQMDVLENALKRAETELDLLEGKISQSRLTQKRLEDQINALSQRLKGFTGELGKDPLAFEQQLARYDQASSLEREVALRREQVSKTQARIAGKKGGFRWIALGAGLFLFIIVAALKAAPGGEFVPAIIWGVTAGVAGFLFSNLGFRLVMKGDAEQLILEQETLRTAEVELAKVEKERQQQLSNASVSNLKELRELFQLYRSHQSELENHQTLLQHLLNESGRHEQELTSAQSQIQDYLMQCKIVAKDEPFQDKSLLRLRQQYLARKENCQKRDN